MFPCGRLAIPMSRREMLARSGAGFGAVALAALGQQWQSAAGGASRRAGIAGAAIRWRRGRRIFRQGQAGHFSVHGRRAVAGRHVRSQAAADRRAWPAVQDEDGADAVQQQRQHARLPLEIRAVRPKRLAGQRAVSARRPACRRAGRGPLDDVEVFRAHDGQLFPAHRPGAAGPAQHGGLVRLRPGLASARTCRALSCSTAA